MNLNSGIKNPSDLKEAIEIAKLHNEQYNDAIYAIHKYKWYNWYQNLHIKKGSVEDAENTAIFDKLKTEHSEIHKDVELNISSEIDRL